MMARYFARIVRAIVVSALGFGGGIGLFTFIAMLVMTGKQNSLQVALQAGIVIGLGFAVFLAFVMLLTDLTTRLYGSQGNTSEEIWDLQQERELTVKAPLRDVRNWSRRALQKVPNIKSVADEDNEIEIRGAVGPSWKSPGERVRVLITPLDETDTAYKVSVLSTSLADNIQFDYGKNFENVESWLKTMRKLMDTAGRSDNNQAQSVTG